MCHSNILIESRKGVIVFEFDADWLKTVPEQLNDLIRFRRDGRFYWELLLSILCFALAYPIGKYAPEEVGYENGIIENTQMFVLFAGVVLCFFAKKNRAFFRFLAAIIFILCLRETNFGKTIFYPDPEIPNKFLSWKEIPYAPLVDPVMILSGIFLAWYFLRKKLFLIIPAFLKDGKVPVWHIIFMVTGIVGGTACDKLVHNFAIEETVELGFYVAMIAAVVRAASAKCLWLPEIEKE